MDLQTLKQNLINVMPILNANLAAAHKEYMDGDIPAGAFGHVRSRHEMACVVISNDDIKAEYAYQSCALLAIDLRSGIKEVVGSDSGLLDAWWQCYRDAGFTEVNPIFKTPMLPSAVPNPAS